MATPSVVSQKELLFCIHLDSRSRKPLHVTKNNNTCSLAFKRMNRDSEPAYLCIQTMINNNSYAMMEILNTIDWMQADGNALIPAVQNLQSKDRMINWMKNFLLTGQEKLKTPMAKPNPQNKGKKKRN